MAVLDEMDEGDEMKPEDEREALARIVNDRHQETRPWHDLVKRTGIQRTNGDDYAIRTAYAAADAILAAGFSRVVPVSDEAVERATDAFDTAWEMQTEAWEADGAPLYPKEQMRTNREVLIRAALEAAYREEQQ